MARRTPSPQPRWITAVSSTTIKTKPQPLRITLDTPSSENSSPQTTPPSPAPSSPASAGRQRRQRGHQQRPARRSAPVQGDGPDHRRRGRNPGHRRQDNPSSSCRESLVIPQCTGKTGLVSVSARTR